MTYGVAYVLFELLFIFAMGILDGLWQPGSGVYMLLSICLVILYVEEEREEESIFSL